MKTIGEIMMAGDLASLSTKAQRLARLSETVAAAVPEATARACRVLNLRDDGTLVISAATNAHAAKLRQIVPAIERAIGGKEGVARITVTVDIPG